MYYIYYLFTCTCIVLNWVILSYSLLDRINDVPGWNELLWLHWALYSMLHCNYAPIDRTVGWMKEISRKPGMNYLWVWESSLINQFTFHLILFPPSLLLFCGISYLCFSAAGLVFWFDIALVLRWRILKYMYVKDRGELYTYASKSIEKCGLSTVTISDQEWRYSEKNWQQLCENMNKKSW